jgi:ATP-dependent DNA ligase
VISIRRAHLARRMDLRDHPFLDRKATLAWLLRDTEAGILLNEHVVEDGPTVFEHACRLGAEGIVSKRMDGTYRSGPCPAWISRTRPWSPSRVCPLRGI